MADVTGALHHAFGGKTYTLRLTLGGIAKLQDKYGNDVGGLLTGGIEGIPPMGLLVSVVAEALVKGEKMPQAEAYELADDIVTADQSIVGQIIVAAFPDAEGNGKAPGTKRKR
ncbi:hypothetical protein HOY34_11075 [Xinfangfangia sp. D13-10-4-6]|uniref:hypothetical protein n=1 Tax=Pseudogemmobacter hezensis TaxID=2737662 RepID=UPI0015537D23|nr:hypothetical protein [Pseudogemmobacter hezensis]NPD15744.1 hypothetical protein [Pseudogemmobacter hezensis]